MESQKRSIAKALSWRFIATFITAIIVWVMTGEAKFAAKVGIADTLIKFLSYYFHERLWARLRFGLHRDSDYQI